MDNLETFCLYKYYCLGHTGRRNMDKMVIGYDDIFEKTQ